MKSTTQTSRKLYALRESFSLIKLITAVYVLGVVLSSLITFLILKLSNECKIFEVDVSYFIAAIGAIGIIVSALNIADGMKGHEPPHHMTDNKE